MTRGHPGLSTGLGALLLAAAAVLAGCAATPSPTDKDRVTASDESSADRRARVRLELASAYYGRGQYTTALDEVKQALAARPELGDAFNLRGLVYAALGDNPRAEESFRHALRIDPQDGDALHNFGWYLCQQKRYPEADELFARALKAPLYRDTTRTLLAQGVCYARAGRLEDAEHALSKSYELDPGNPSTAFNLAELLYRRGELQRARFYIRRVNASEQQSNAQSLWLAARIEHKLGNRRGTDDYGDQLRNRFPSSPEAAAFARGQFDG